MTASSVQLQALYFLDRYRLLQAVAVLRQGHHRQARWERAVSALDERVLDLLARMHTHSRYPSDRRDEAYTRSYRAIRLGWRPRSGVNERTGVGSLQDRQVTEGRTHARGTPSIPYRPYPRPH